MQLLLKLFSPADQTSRDQDNQLSAGMREYAVELVRQSYRDFGPTLAAEALLERHGVEVSRETLRKWMVEDYGCPASSAGRSTSLACDVRVTQNPKSNPS